MLRLEARGVLISFLIALEPPAFELKWNGTDWYAGGSWRSRNQPYGISLVSAIPKGLFQCHST
ncbi:hypothetical protein [Coleofasciculus sp.]|uniref:hypothetical protein n=1 Tax=Coleofasciculus sp. TaxID=3100458 RepID=UPI003A482557